MRLGELNIRSFIDCEIDEDGTKVCADPIQDLPIESIKIHENYSRAKYANDIALVRLAHPANTDANNVRSICLPTTTDVADSDLKNLIIAGWGQTENSARDMSNELLKAYLPFVPNDRCDAVFKNARKVVPIHKSAMCAGGSRSDTCHGDSG